VFIFCPYSNVFIKAIKLFGYDLAGLVNGLTYNQQIKNLEARRESLLFSKVTPMGISSRSTCVDEQDYTNLDDDEEYYDV